MRRQRENYERNKLLKGRSSSIVEINSESNDSNLDDNESCVIEIIKENQPKSTIVKKAETAVPTTITCKKEKSIPSQSVYIIKQKNKKIFSNGSKSTDIITSNNNNNDKDLTSIQDYSNRNVLSVYDFDFDSDSNVYFNFNNSFKNSRPNNNIKCFSRISV
jgi:hypothetical protein